MMETPVPDSVSAVHNATNATRDVESEAGQEGKIREIVMDNVDSEPMVCDIENLFHTSLKYVLRYLQHFMGACADMFSCIYKKKLPS